MEFASKAEERGFTFARVQQLEMLRDELVKALEGIVERGTDSPQHLAVERAIAKAKGE